MLEEDVFEKIFLATLFFPSLFFQEHIKFFSLGGMPSSLLSISSPSFFNLHHFHHSISLNIFHWLAQHFVATTQELAVGRNDVLLFLHKNQKQPKKQPLLISKPKNLLQKRNMMSHKTIQQKSRHLIILGKGISWPQRPTIEEVDIEAIPTYEYTVT